VVDRSSPASRCRSRVLPRPRSTGRVDWCASTCRSAGPGRGPCPCPRSGPSLPRRPSVRPDQGDDGPAVGRADGGMRITQGLSAARAPPHHHQQADSGAQHAALHRAGHRGMQSGPRLNRRGPARRGAVEEEPAADPLRRLHRRSPLDRVSRRSYHRQLSGSRQGRTDDRGPAPHRCDARMGGHRRAAWRAARRGPEGRPWS